MLERNHDREQGHGPAGVSSQDPNSDDDDHEALLREKALKSLAVKRKAKLDVGVKDVIKINLYLGQMCNDSCTR